MPALRMMECSNQKLQINPKLLLLGFLPLYHKPTKRRVDRSIRAGALSLRDGRLQAPQIAPCGLYHGVSLARFILKNDDNYSEALLC
jgi:hypothetical protein